MGKTKKVINDIKERSR